MTHLSACYFCGTALDEPLEEYPVVPAELAGDGDRHAVTLCPSCQEKLDDVLGLVVAAVEEGERSPAAEASTDEPAAGPPTGDDGPTAENTPEPGLSSDHLVDPGSSESEPAEETTTTAQDTDDTNEPAEPAESAERAESEASAAQDTPPGDDSAMTTADPTESGHAAEPTDDATSGSAAGEDAADTDEETGGAGDDGATMSALEYNKVMRLLQNREFPVDRTEIETVAANAYGLSREDCAEVIDLAIDRDLIETNADGQLTRPD